MILTQNVLNISILRTASNVTVNSSKNFATNKTAVNKSKELYRYLVRQCAKLPEGANKYYRFMIKQSFKQHVNEKDPERIEQIIRRAYEDADWILKKVQFDY
ncbi:unnamed protein product [Acanthoscelides obtectus]|uniref:LYR motif-containing protein 9 n=1 Tax=Acanthoscelides obtectus TaxID=200917 RepID=A0A9P0KZK5_ACAOB|nr:unnamed protein product [Acanthoscelides obtectus]CAK1626460.1 LYR motif-containing protein 9 [Acanthoscelides obtectus]